MKLLEIIGFLCLISLCNSCKKEFSDEFDPIIGTWTWYKTNRNYKGNQWINDYTQTHLLATGSSDQYKIEFSKKGIVKLSRNGEIEKKYKVRDSKGSTNYNPAYGNSWIYEIYFRKNERMGITYYVNGDTLITGFFPFDNEDGYYSYTNTFIRE